MRRWLFRHEQKTLPRIVTDDQIELGAAQAAPLVTACLVYSGDAIAAHTPEKFKITQVNDPPSMELHRSGSAQIELNKKKFTAHYCAAPTHLDITIDGFYYRLMLTNFTGKGGHQDHHVDLRSEIPGRVVKVIARVGAVVEMGDILLIQEAMKMEMSLKAPARLKIAEILVDEGIQVEADMILIRFEAAVE